MKVLMVNKFHYIKGGSETYYFALKNMLESQGHTVIDFSMKDEKNYFSPYNEYFVENVDYSNPGGICSKIKVALQIIYSMEAKKKFERLIQKTKPDLIHLHIFQHQLSPSILDVIKKYNIPTVYTAHDLKMICLNYKMMHHDVICEECKGEKYINCLKNKCVKESYLKSCINVIEGYFHKLRKSYDAIDMVITPSAFYRDKFIEFGVDAKRVIHIPNFLDREKPEVNLLENSKNYLLYFGRISEEKGVMTLIKAMEEMDYPLYIVGTGPLKDEIENYVSEKKLRHIQILGFKSGQELIDLVGNARAIVLPSEWYENGPYSAIEALQLGRPIIGANIGGIPELIRENGLLFESGNVADLKEKIQWLNSLNSEEYHKMEEASVSCFEEFYTSISHNKKLQSVYEAVLNK